MQYEFTSIFAYFSVLHVASAILLFYILRKGWKQRLQLKQDGITEYATILMNVTCVILLDSCFKKSKNVLYAVNSVLEN
jgi:hypothetical protein